MNERLNEVQDRIFHEGGREFVEEEEEKYFCGVCDHTSYSLEAYQEHVVSQLHVSRAARVFHLEVPTKKQVREESKDKEIHHCSICDVNCNGDICWTAHLQGAKHKKREKQKLLEEEILKAAQERGIPQGVGESIRKENVATTMQDFINYPEPLIGLEYITEIQIIGEAPQFYCELCDTRFNNNTKFPHVTGVKHRLAVIKKKDYEWSKKITSTCDKRSDLTVRLASAASKLEEQEGRLNIKVKTEKVFAKERTTPERTRYSDEEVDEGELVDSDGQGNSASGTSDKIHYPSLMTMKPGWNFNGGILPTPDASSTDVTDSQRHDSNVDDERESRSHRNRSRDRERSRHDRSRSKDKRHRSESRDRERRIRSRSPSRGRSIERRKHLEMSPSHERRFGSKDRKDGPPFPVKIKGEGRDFSDEIQEEMRRQAKRAEEKRRAEERRKRHAEREAREEAERREERRKRRKEEEANKATPPPEAPRSLDDDTKRLVMQNLTELAKCCVTNEADAELALQVSNALTQALLQYRMKNMPASVLQSLTQQQNQLQLMGATGSFTPHHSNPSTPQQPPNTLNFNPPPPQPPQLRPPAPFTPVESQRPHVPSTNQFLSSANAAVGFFSGNVPLPNGYQQSPQIRMPIPQLPMPPQQQNNLPQQTQRFPNQTNPPNIPQTNPMPNYPPFQQQPAGPSQQQRMQPQFSQQRPPQQQQMQPQFPPVQQQQPVMPPQQLQLPQQPPVMQQQQQPHHPQQQPQQQQQPHHPQQQPQQQQQQTQHQQQPHHPQQQPQQQQQTQQQQQPHVQPQPQQRLPFVMPQQQSQQQPQIPQQQRANHNQQPSPQQAPLMPVNFQSQNFQPRPANPPNRQIPPLMANQDPRITIHQQRSLPAMQAKPTKPAKQPMVPKRGKETVSELNERMRQEHLQRQREHDLRLKQQDQLQHQMLH